MKYLKYIAVLGSLVLGALPAKANVELNISPVSLVTSPISVKASSEPIPLFSFAGQASASETLSSVSVTVNNSGSSTSTGADLGVISVYKDDGDGEFETNGDDVLVDSQSTVAIGTPTVVLTGSSANNDLDGDKFFITMTTDSGWSDVSPKDQVTVTLSSDSIVTSEDSPTITALTTSVISADSTGPSISSAIASLDASDHRQLVLTFDEATDKPAISASNINSVLDLNNSHSWLSGVGSITSADWNSAGTALTVVLDSDTSNPTVAVGDTITLSGSVIQDAAGNAASGTETITGSFSQVSSGDTDEGDDETGSCANGLHNGRIYKLAGTDHPTVYLAAACILKPFRGQAAFHARGHKFQDIIVLDSLSGYTISDKPALPAGGTLIKGSDATVWIVTKQGKRKGFVSLKAFVRLGFDFSNVDQISDSDLATMDIDTPVTETDEHPDGTVAKCANSAIVFEIRDHEKFPFTSAEIFALHGHSFQQIAVIDCGRFAYLNGQNISQ